MMSQNQEMLNNARAYPVISDAQRHRPTSANVRGLPRQERARLKRRAPVALRVATLNVGTLTGRGREVVDLMRRRRVIILCVQETRWRGNKAKEMGEGYKLFYSSATEEGRNGVGIVISQEMKEYVTEVTRNGDRLITVRLMYGDCAINIVSAYAPQTDSTDEVKDEFWRKLDSEIERIPVEERIVLGADLNGHVGANNESVQRIHGGHGFGRLNADGERILDLAIAFDLAIANTFFCKRDEPLITYKSGGNDTQIDYLMYRRTNLVEIRNCKVIPGDHMAPQHRLLVMDMWLRRPTKGKKRYEKRIRWSALKDQQKRQEFKTKVLNRVAIDIDGVQDWWKENAKILKGVAREVLGETSEKPRTRREEWWWKEDIRDALERKKEAKKRWEQSRTAEDRNEYKTANKLAKKAVAVAKAEACRNLYEELETPSGERKIYMIAKGRNKASKDLSHVKQIKDRNGVVLTDDEKIKGRWKEYYAGLSNEENPRVYHEDGVPHQGPTKCLEREEVVRALQRMKNNKATGPDEIPVEAWRALGAVGVDLLLDLMRKIEQQEDIPDEWRESVLIPISKGKGDIQDCGKYRGIKLLSHTMKIWERILDMRLRTEVNLYRGQFGFMPGKGTTNPIFILRQLAEKYREKQKELHMVFIDLEKAYDRVPRQELWRCMRKKNIPEKYVRLVKEMYRNVRTSVRSEVGMSESFSVEVGLHQGSVLSPFLFNIVFDVLTEGISEEPPWNMMYADDVVLVDETREGLERRLEEWRFAIESRGMKISREKTEYMVCKDQNNGRGESIRLEGVELKKVEAFKYLGSTLSADGSEEKEVASRIKAGWNSWRDMSGVLCDRKMPIKLKGKVYKTVVRPAMAYGMETLAIKKKNEKKMEVAEMRMLRWMCAVTREDRISNKRIRGTVKVVEISKKAQEARLRWYGHVMRREEESDEKRALDMEVQGRRRRGRPRTRWKDCIAADLGEKGLNTNEAANRNGWRRLIKNSDPV